MVPNGTLDGGNAFWGSLTEGSLRHLLKFYDWTFKVFFSIGIEPSEDGSIQAIEPSCDGSTPLKRTLEGSIIEPQ